MFNSREKKFQDIAKRLFNTPEGMELLAYLKRDILDCSPLAEDTYLVYYNIGKQDLVRGFVDLVENKEVLSEISTFEYDPMTN